MEKLDKRKWAFDRVSPTRGDGLISGRKGRGSPPSMRAAKYARDLIGELFQIRIEKNISLRELADRAGVSKEAYVRWRRSGRSPMLVNFIDTAEALGCEVRLIRKDAATSDCDAKSAVPSLSSGRPLTKGGLG